MKRLSAIVVLIAGSGAALAHSGVMNAQVLARMDGMKSIGQNVGVLGDMAKGKTTFDAPRAEAAKAALILHAANVEDLFTPPETDPKSEALPAIWQDWAGFAANADDMQRAVAALNTATLDDVRAGLGQIGKTCSSCHEIYRLDK